MEEMVITMTFYPDDLAYIREIADIEDKQDLLDFIWDCIDYRYFHS